MSYVREVSPYLTNQGIEDVCWAHSIARLISRLIKIQFGERQHVTDEFMFDEGELLDEYYDTINCSSEKTIFHCIAHVKDVYEQRVKPSSIYNSLNKVINWESENLSAMLFHFIFNSVKNKYGCDGLEYSCATPIFYFLKQIRQHITEEKIKDILNYSNYQLPPFSLSPSQASSISPSLAVEQSTFRQVKENKVMFSRLIRKLVSLFKILRISLENKTLKINLFNSFGLGEFHYINDEGAWHITRRILLLSSDFVERIRQVLEQGLYVILCIYKHAILITGIEGQFFFVKNSWGTNRNWTLQDGEQFIVDNKLSISTLIEHSNRVSHEFVFIEFETPKYEIFTKEKLPNKSIIHTFKKTAKRLSRYFGEGRKIKKFGKKTKKYYNKK